MTQEFTKPPLYMIYAPLGGFGNHIRWLCLLNDLYVLENIKEAPGPLITVGDKLKFLKEIVYSNNRTHNNWLKYEWTWRDSLSNYLKFTHDMIDCFDDLKTVAVKIDPDLAYRSYVKFNPDLNGINQNSFFQLIRKHNRACDFLSNYLPTVITVDSTTLFQPNLDIDLYNQILHFFNLIDNSNIDKACEVHELWYNLHIKAEREWLQTNHS